MNLDYYKLDIHYFYDFLKYCKKHNVKLYRIDIKNEYVYFYAPIYQRYRINQFDIHVIRMKSIGIVSYLLFAFINTKKITFMISFVLFFMFCSNCILDVRIIGNHNKINISLLERLKEYDISFFMFKKSYLELNEIMLELKQYYSHDIEYLNLYYRGNVFYVEYLPQHKKNIESDNYQNLYASQDGLIKSIHLDNGVCKVKVNDYVKKGDLLVENYVVSTQNESLIIPVKGEIYAYTFKQYTAKKKFLKEDDVQLFYELLLSIRSKIPSGVKIDVEKVLQIDRTHSTITLKMHYTLIENIAIEGESREENH